MQKQAINANAVAKIIQTLAGGAAGGALGYYGTPHMFGYADVPEARRSSAILDAALGAAAGFMGPKQLKLMMRPGAGKLTAKNVWPTMAKRTAPLTALLAGETLPIAQSVMHKQRETAKDISQAASQLSDTTRQMGDTVKSVGDAAHAVAANTIPASLQRLLTSNIGRGAGVGAAGAGLAAILTGLNRRQTEEERVARKTRGGMVSKDFLKYLIPAVIAGGVTGSLVPTKQNVK